MNTTIPSSTLPNWIRGLIAISTGIVVFRLSTLIASFIPFLMPNFLLSVLYHLNRWDFILVPGACIAAAVLVSRWAEHKLRSASRRAGMVAATGISILAWLPIEFRVMSDYVMASPLHIAISRDYSVETVEAIIDRYPTLVNGRETPWEPNPLVEVALAGKADLVDLLIARGADVDKAVVQLQQLNAERALKLVLDSAKNHNKRVETNRRPALPLDGGWKFESTAYAPPFLSAAVAHPFRWTGIA